MVFINNIIESRYCDLNLLNYIGVEIVDITRFSKSNVNSLALQQ